MTQQIEDLLHAIKAEDSGAEQAAAQVRELGGDLGQLAQDTLARFEEVYQGGDFDPAQAGELRALGQLADVISTVQQEQAAAERERAEIADLANQVQAVAENTTTGGDPEQAEPAESADNPAEEPQEAPAGDSGTDAPEDTPASEQAETVAADGARPDVAAAVQETQVSSGAPAPTSPAPLRSLSITAAADVPDVPHRAKLDMKDAGRALTNAVRDMPGPGEPPATGRRGIINVQREFDPSLVVDGHNTEAVDALIDRISDETQLPGGSLVAAAKQQMDAVIAAGKPLATPPGDIWCSPSTQDYSLCPALANATSGIWDAPTFTQTRGGVRYTVWPQYPDQHRPAEHREIPNSDEWKDNDQDQTWPENVQNGQGPVSGANPNLPPRHDWHGYAVPYEHGLDNPNHFLNEPKKYIEGPCPEWREERMNLAYLWVRGDRLRDHTYSEVGQRFLSDVLVSHRRFMNENYIRWVYHHSDRLADFDASTPAMFGPAGTVPPGPSSPPGPSYPGRHAAPRAWYETTNEWWPGGPKDTSSLATFAMGSASEALIEKLGLLVTWFRDAYRTDFTYSLEGFAPYWLRNLIKVDLERKSNRPHNLPVTDAEVDAIFLQWGVRMQWVYDFQSMPSEETELRDANGALLPPNQQRIMPPNGWPNACDLVLYPAGAWSLAQSQILRIAGEQALDTLELAQQKYTRLFMEDSWMLLNKCQRSFVVRLTNLCANGAVGARREVCEVGATSGTAVSSLAMDKATASVAAGATTPLKATASTTDGFSKDVTKQATWTSDDPSIATVSGGTVTGVKEGGPVTIKAEYQGHEATSAVTVTAASGAQAASKSSK